MFWEESISMREGIYACAEKPGKNQYGQYLLDVLGGKYIDA